MTTPTRFILLAIGLVIAAGVFMMPRRDEWLAVMQDEDQQAQVIALVEDRLARGEDDPDLLATLGRSYAAVGSNQRAIERIEAYTTLRPTDAEALPSWPTCMEGSATRRARSRCWSGTSPSLRRRRGSPNWRACTTRMGKP